MTLVMQAELYNPRRDEATSSWIRQMPTGFRDWLEEQIKREMDMLSTASEMTQIYRAQGRAEIFSYLMELRKGA